MKTAVRKILITVGVSAVLVAAISSASFGTDISPDQTQSPMEQNAAENTKDPEYIIGIYSGYVAVYKYGEDMPVQITNVPVAELTEGDILLLTKGIGVADEQELNKRLEDYTG